MGFWATFFQFYENSKLKLAVVWPSKIRFSHFLCSTLSIWCKITKNPLDDLLLADWLMSYCRFWPRALLNTTSRWSATEKIIIIHERNYKKKFIIAHPKTFIPFTSFLSTTRALQNVYKVAVTRKKNVSIGHCVGSRQLNLCNIQMDEKHFKIHLTDLDRTNDKLSTVITVIYIHTHGGAHFNSLKVVFYWCRDTWRHNLLRKVTENEGSKRLIDLQDCCNCSRCVKREIILKVSWS